MSFSIMLSTLGEGMLRTCAIFILTVLFSLPLGLVIMFLRRSRFFIVRTITKFYIAIMRGTPLMLQLLMWYFGPYYLFGMNIRGYRFAAIIIGFSMNYAAYFAEIYRGGMETIPQGQYEAAEVLGYSKAQTFFKIILPQVVKAILPSVTRCSLWQSRSRHRRHLSCRSWWQVCSILSRTTLWHLSWSVLRRDLTTISKFQRCRIIGQHARNVINENQQALAILCAK